MVLRDSGAVIRSHSQEIVILSGGVSFAESEAHPGVEGYLHAIVHRKLPGTSTGMFGGKSRKRIKLKQTQ
jgi:hypothetical protein